MPRTGNQFQHFVRTITPLYLSLSLSLSEHKNLIGLQTKIAENDNCAENNGGEVNHEPAYQLEKQKR